jgi:preprotein translocase subunit SecE
MNTYLTDGSWPGLMAAAAGADYVTIGIWAAVIGVVFAILWFTGNLVKLRNYVLETREELRKCTWPTWEELRGSTVVVMISIFLLGVFTVVIDQLLFVLVNWMVKI